MKRGRDWVAFNEDSQRLEFRYVTKQERLENAEKWKLLKEDNTKKQRLQPEQQSRRDDSNTAGSSSISTAQPRHVKQPSETVQTPQKVTRGPACRKSKVNSNPTANVTPAATKGNKLPVPKNPVACSKLEVKSAMK